MLIRNFISKIILTMMFVAFAVPASFAQFISSDFKKLNHFIQTSNPNEKAVKAFRIGRDLIEDEKWEQAEKHFRNFLRDYPNYKEADAAIYWLAFTQKKQNHFNEVEELLVRLNTEYPNSNWLDDAKALRLEIAPSVGNIAYVTEVIRPARVVAQAVRPRPMPAPEPATAPTLGELRPVSPLAPISPAQAAELDARVAELDSQVAVLDSLTIANQASVRSKLDEKDEIKAIALQSLMQSNPERALPYIADILKNNSKASAGLKEQAIRLLGHYGAPNSLSILFDLARSQSDPKIRRSAIYSLGNVENEKALDLLLELATKSDDIEVSKAALRALSMQDNPKARQKMFEIARSSSNEDLRVQAVQGLANRGDDSLVDELVKIYQSDKSLKVRRQVILGLSQLVGHGFHFNFPARVSSSNKSTPVSGIVSGPAQESVSGTGKVSEAAEKRKEAQRLKGEKATKALLQLYDSETDESLKNHFLSAFSHSGSKEALQKLMQIAKSDSSLTLRRRAVMSLGQSDDPEAAKFLEEILK